MPSLLTDAEKAVLVSDFQSVVDTFVRPLVVYQEAQKVVIITNPDFNPIDQWNQNNTDIQNVPIYTTISGRILWDKQQDWKFANVGQNAQLKTKDQTTQAVRIKVDASGYNLLKSAKKVEVDGVMLDPMSQPRPHGLFTPNYYTLYFERAE